jgi:ribose transport system permease protein
VTTITSPTGQQSRRVARSLAGAILGRNAALLLALAAFLALLGLRTDHYLTFDNLRVVALEMTPIAIASVGTTVLMVTGNIDLSIGSNFALAAVTAAMLSLHTRPLIAMVVGVLVAAAVGLGNGLLVWRIKLSPLIVTLGSLTLVRAIVLLVTQGIPVDGIPGGFTAIGQARPLGIPTSVWVALSAALIAGAVLTTTTTGRHLYAIGGNREASEAAGIPVRALVLGAFCLNGALVGVAGVLVASRFGTADPTFGNGFELDVITAVILGGVAFAGGEGGVRGVILAVALLGVVNSGIIALGVNAYWAGFVKGGALIFAVALDQLVHEQRERYRRAMARRERLDELSAAR